MQEHEALFWCPMMPPTEGVPLYKVQDPGQIRSPPEELFDEYLSDSTVGESDEEPAVVDTPAVEVEVTARRTRAAVRKVTASRAAVSASATKAAERASRSKKRKQAATPSGTGSGSVRIVLDDEGEEAGSPSPRAGQGKEKVAKVTEVDTARSGAGGSGEPASGSKSAKRVPPRPVKPPLKPRYVLTSLIYTYDFVSCLVILCCF